MVILSKASKPQNFESHNSLNLSFTNILKFLGREENLIWGHLAFYWGLDNPLETMLYYLTLINLLVTIYTFSIS